MKRERKRILASLMAMLMVLVMVVSLIPTLTANAATTSKKASYKEVKTINYTLAGKEIRTLTFSAGIVKISFGSQSAVRMKKVTDKKVRITGVRNGKTRFVVVTKDQKKIVCNITRSHTLNVKPRSKKVVKTSLKVKSVKSSNTKIAKVTKAKDKKSYTVSTTGKHGKAKITIKYVNNTSDIVTVSNHTWKTKKVKDAWDETIVDTPEKTQKVKVKDAWDETKKVKIKDAYDEQVYMYDTVIHNVTGEDMLHVDFLSWCEAHNCAIHFLGDGPCACDTHTEPVYKTVHHDAEYTTKTIHHDAEYTTKTVPAKTHTVHHDAQYVSVTYCSKCGKTK